MSEPLNLIPLPRLEARRRQSAVRRWCLGGALYAALLVGAAVFVQMRWGGEPADLAAALSEATAQAEAARGQLHHLRTDLSAVERRLAANRAVTNQPDYAVLLALFAQQLDEEVLLRSCRFEPIPLAEARAASARAMEIKQGEAELPPGFTVHATGLAANQRAVSAYVLRLEQTRLFHRVRLVNTRREPTNFGSGQAIAFEIECHLATQGAAAEDAGPGTGGDA